MLKHDSTTHSLAPHSSNSPPSFSVSQGESIFLFFHINKMCPEHCGCSHVPLPVLVLLFSPVPWDTAPSTTLSHLVDHHVTH